MEMENGCLVISLDFELLWGIFDKVDWREREEYFLNTRRVIPKILDGFEKNNIACTWATVGMLFNENWEEWQTNIPQELPDYINNKLSPYKYGYSIASEKTKDFCFAPDLIRQIVSTPGQEIGSHTYSHYYCLEKGQGEVAFRADLKKAIEMAQKLNIKLDSLVFPRNQFNKEYLNVCEELGLTIVRTNPTNWYWRDTEKNDLKRKVFRTGDAYLGPRDKSYRGTEIHKLETGMVEQKASRLFRPHSNMILFDKLRLSRIKSEMTYAARHNEIYHLWWHPHNFGDHPEESLKELLLLLDHYNRLKEEFGFSCLTMKGLNSLLNE